MKPHSMTTRSLVALALLGLFIFAPENLPALATTREAARATTIFAEATTGTAVSAPTEAEEAAAVARETLARLPAEARLGEIKNERLRRAVQTAYRAVVELADNREAGKVSALNAKFERLYAAVERETAHGEYQTCVVNCKAGDGEPCRSACKSARKKFCGCKLILFGCLVAECLF